MAGVTTLGNPEVVTLPTRVETKTRKENAMSDAQFIEIETLENEVAMLRAKMRKAHREERATLARALHRVEVALIMVRGL